MYTHTHMHRYMYCSNLDNRWLHLLRDAGAQLRSPELHLQQHQISGSGDLPGAMTGFWGRNGETDGRNLKLCEDSETGDPDVGLFGSWRVTHAATGLWVSMSFDLTLRPHLTAEPRNFQVQRGGFTWVDTHGMLLDLVTKNCGLGGLQVSSMMLVNANHMSINANI